MKTSQIILSVLGAIVLLLGLTWIFQGNDFFLYQKFAPQYEQTRRQVFEKSKAYNQGTIQNLRDAERDYITAPPDRRAGLGSVIIQQYADYPDENLPNDLRVFMSCLRSHQAQSFDCSPGAVQ